MNDQQNISSSFDSRDARNSVEAHSTSSNEQNSSSVESNKDVTSEIDRNIENSSISSNDSLSDTEYTNGKNFSYTESSSSISSNVFLKNLLITVAKQVTLWLIFIYFQHVGTVLLIILLQAYYYKKLSSYSVQDDKEAKLGWIVKGGFRSFYWYWFILASLFFHWKTLNPQFSLEFKVKYHLPVTAKDESEFEFAIFFGYALSIVGFVLTLHKSHYRYQFERFAYCHILILIFVLSCCSIANVFMGLVYFILPVQLVALNSFLTSILRGNNIYTNVKRFNLLNKTFIFSYLATISFSFILVRILRNYSIFICPKNDIYAEFWPVCESELFEVVSLETFFIHRPVLIKLLPASVLNFEICKFDGHAFWFSQFVALVLPFGEYFTQHFKRVFRIKDDLGYVNKLGCLTLIGVFVFTQTYVYRAERNSAINPKDFLEISKNLNEVGRLQIYKKLGQHLAKHQLLDEP